jgi:hypothetical protein
MNAFYREERLTGEGARHRERLIVGVASVLRRGTGAQDEIPTTSALPIVENIMIGRGA